MLSDEWLPRYRLLENFTAKWNGNGNGNAYDRGDYNSSFALRAVELKRHLKIIIFTAVKNRCMLHGHVFVMDEILKVTWSRCLMLYFVLPIL